MRISKLELVAGLWAVCSVGLMGLIATIASPAVSLTVAFALLLVTVMAAAYALLNSVRKVGRSGNRAAEQARRQLHSATVAISGTQRALKDSEAARARAATAENVKLNALAQAVRDSEAARARAVAKVYSRLNTLAADVRQLETVTEEVQRLAMASRDKLGDQAGERIQLANSFTQQTVKLELYVDEMRDAIRSLAPNHKQQVLESIYAD